MRCAACINDAAMTISMNIRAIQLLSSEWICSYEKAFWASSIPNPPRMVDAINAGISIAATTPPPLNISQKNASFDPRGFKIILSIELQSLTLAMLDKEGQPIPKKV